MPEWVESAVSIGVGLAILVIRKPFVREIVETNRLWHRPYRGEPAVVGAIVTCIAIGFILMGLTRLLGRPSAWWVVLMVFGLLAVVVPIAYFRGRNSASKHGDDSDHR